MTNREPQLADAFVDLADTLVNDFDAVDFLHSLVGHLVDLLDVTAAGIMMSDQRGGLEVLASSSEETRLLELFETQNDEGPCLDCFRSGEPVGHVDMAAMRKAWPVFTPRMVEAGFQSAQAIPLRLRRQTIGAVNVFRSESGLMAAGDLKVGRALADVATIGLIQSRSITARDTVAEQLQSALNSRILIEQAKGAFAERTGLGVDEAFQVMRAYARSTGRRLSDVGAQVLDGTLDPATLGMTRSNGPG
ncbi:MAG: GAF and ANTAR domain-containing protein [Geodermatophilaceae bacterium]|nr:GAF and ANTAR domain-containing protein [Geodermatophilaceae bacterium]